MDLLEAALRHSIDWSMRHRRTMQSTTRPNNLIPSNDELKDGIELMNLRIREESYIRAFITHFKIELNHLMGLKWARHSQRDNSGEDEDSISERDSLDTEDELWPIVQVHFGTTLKGNRMLRSAKPSIKINGKYSGVYSLNGQTDDDEESMIEDNVILSRNRATKLTTEDDCVDDGYRSLSRGSISRISLLQQLNDIKSRVIDLVQEIDSSVGSSPHFNEDDLEAYRRRRDALVSKLDALIESQKMPNSLFNDVLSGMNETSSPSASSSSPSIANGMYQRNLKLSTKKAIIKNKSESNLHQDGYEEQVQIIDYNRRRASDCNTES